ncbi:hypothetical protein HYC85_004764 [Camellia sinensis]|uniref:Uncharacterized protein n=1 Tax=Camellia sinensis TaxID=4442 RepID=A0A7J7HY13_CAMSI|nr:hypothetical protein HYC85_004764 [Camellia sinensis]
MPTTVFNALQEEAEEEKAVKTRPGQGERGDATAVLACERECSRGEDYRLIKLTITDYTSKAERFVVVECRGHDAARFRNIDHAHGWEKDVVGMVEQEHGKSKILISFDCETLKADKAAEDHIRQFMPKLAGMDAVGRMSIEGLDFEAEAEQQNEHIHQNI